MLKLFVALVLICTGAAVHAERVEQDQGRARRIITLAPHLAEMIFAVGAGGQLVGTVDYSTYPEEAKKIPSIGGYTQFNLEAIIALKPDLIIAWRSGNSAAQVRQLQDLGFSVYVSQTDRIEDIPRELVRLGEQAGTREAADAEAARLNTRLSALRDRYAELPRVRTFYQIWKQPLTTIGGGQIISSVIRLCGGENVFDSQESLVVNITVESVIAANPEVILASGMDQSRPEWLDDWRAWKSIEAVARDNLFFIDPDLMQRHTPRLLDGAEFLCKHLETARSRRQ